MSALSLQGGRIRGRSSSSRMRMRIVQERQRQRQRQQQQQAAEGDQDRGVRQVPIERRHGVDNPVEPGPKGRVDGDHWAGVAIAIA